MTERDDQARFFGKLSVLVDGGAPLLSAFETALVSVRDRSLRAALDRILDRAVGGTSLTEAFTAEGERFSPEVMLLLATGERTGDIERKAAAIARGLAEGAIDVPSTGNADAAEALDELLRRAVAEGAEEILVEPHPSGGRVRLRLDGRWAPAPAGVPAHAIGRAAVERSAGRGGFREGGVHCEVRTIPAVDGDETSIRLHRGAAGGLDAAGFAGPAREEVERWLAGGGLVVVAAAARDVRDELAFAMLSAIDGEAKKIAVFDDSLRRPLGAAAYPRELAARVGEFGHLDVVAVPEPDGPAPATAAASAASQGTLVFLPETAPDAAAGLARLLASGLDPDLLAAALVGVAAVRRLPARTGRVAVAEAAPATSALRAAIRSGGDAPAFRAAMRQDGAILLADRAAELVANGTVDEIALERAFGKTPRFP